MASHGMNQHGFLTTKNKGLLIERKRCEWKTGKLLEEFNAWREPDGRGTGYE